MSTERETITQKIVLLVVCIGSMLSPLTMSSVNIALPVMAAELQADARLISWLPTIFLVSNIALILPFGKLADNYGRKRIYMSGLLVTVLASSGAALASNIEQVLCFRFVQGAASAMTLGTGVAMVTSVYPANNRGLAIGINSACIYIGLTAAPVLGGLATETFGWRSVFLLPVPIALLLVALIAVFVKVDWRKDYSAPFDWQGALIFASGTTLLVVALTELPQFNAILMLLVALALIALFVWHQSDRKEPLIRWQMFTQSRLYSCSLASGFFMYASIYPLVFLLSLYMQYIRGMSPTDTGQVILLQGLAMAILAPFSGKFSDIIHPRIIASTGCLVVACGFLMLSQLGRMTPPFYIGSAFFLIGIGMGLFTSPNNNAVLSAVSEKDLGIATATLHLARVMGNLIGMSVVNLLINFNLGDQQIVPEHYGLLESTINTAIIFSLAYVIVGGCLSILRGGAKSSAA